MRFNARMSQGADVTGNIAEEYHASTRMPGVAKRDFFTAHEINYRYNVRQAVAEAPVHRSGVPRLALPGRRMADDMTLDQAITSRRSERKFANSSLSARDLASVLFLGNGVRAVEGEKPDERFYQRNVPNSGGLSSVEVYPIVMNITEIKPGIYHFDSVEHDLAQLRAGQFRPWLEEIVLFQTELATAAVALVLTSAVGRLQSKYGPRGYRLGLLDVGHVAQNCYLAATALGLRVCATAGFIDAELDDALGVDGVEVSTMLVILIGPSR
jgi:SagB-type dehydrogenase family enzyme